jgi:hypothetical protein
MRRGASNAATGRQQQLGLMDLNMMIVETGSSMGSVAKPKAPPAAPELRRRCA